MRSEPEWASGHRPECNRAHSETVRDQVSVGVSCLRPRSLFGELWGPGKLSETSCPQLLPPQSGGPRLSLTAPHSSFHYSNTVPKPSSTGVCALRSHPQLPPPFSNLPQASFLLFHCLAPHTHPGIFKASSSPGTPPSTLKGTCPSLPSESPNPIRLRAPNPVMALKAPKAAPPQLTGFFQFPSRNRLRRTLTAHLLSAYHVQSSVGSGRVP